MHLAGLSYSVAAVLSLRIHSRVPVRVVKYNSVGTGEIETETTAACGKDKEEDARIAIEALRQLLTMLNLLWQISGHKRTSKSKQCREKKKRRIQRGSVPSLSRRGGGKYGHAG